jgi:hypothetical protein
MPSSFPGMDPYLEHPVVFPGLHYRFIAVLSEFLQAGLPAPYYAEIGERVWVEVSQQFIEPDATVRHDQRREPFVEILAPGNGSERLVTAIELLSPSNKAAGERGRELYLRKQREVLESPAHLVEIDLLRGGVHTTAVPLDRLLAQVGPFDYHVSVHRSDRFEDFLVYPVRLDERLPEIAVPLLGADPDVPMDLQAVFDRAYDTGPYRRRIRYTKSAPVPPLRPDQDQWVARVVQGVD